MTQLQKGSIIDTAPSERPPTHPSLLLFLLLLSLDCNGEVLVDELRMSNLITNASTEQTLLDLSDGLRREDLSE
jgi:hypothetical protein